MFGRLLSIIRLLKWGSGVWMLVRNSIPQGFAFIEGLIARIHLRVSILASQRLFFCLLQVGALGAKVFRPSALSTAPPAFSKIHVGPSPI